MSEPVEGALAVAIQERREQATRLLSSVQASLPGRWELLAWAVILSLALALRLWDLGGRALHHDESLHATYSWYFFDGRGYHHDPMMHGPFQFHAGALAFVLFGPSDFVARVPAALFGTGIVALVYLLRGHLGRLGALTAALFITLSPTLLYFSRFSREDIYTAFWTLAIAVCVWRYLAEKRPDGRPSGRNLWLYLGAASLAFAFATKESTYLVAAIFLTFLEVLVAVDLLSQARRHREMDRVEAGSIFVWLLFFSWLLVILWPLLAGLRRRWGLNEFPTAAAPLLVLGTLAAPLYAAGLQLIGDEVPFLPGNSGYASDDELALRNGSVTVLLILALYIGLLWNPRVWLISAAAFYGVYVLLFTTFFSNPAGFWTGIWGSVDYWIEQQSVRRGEQPIFYYFMLLPVYEFLTLLLAIGGAVWLAFRRNAFTLFLIFWIAGALLAFTMAGEKMPWLTVHMALPIALLAGRTVEELYGRIGLARQAPLPKARRARGRPSERVEAPPVDLRLLLALAAAAGALAVIVLIVLSASTTAVVLAILLALGAAAGAFVARQAGGRALLQVGTATVVAGLLVFSIRTAGVASFEHGDIPVELLVYTQTSPDIPRLRDAIEEVGKVTGLGRDVPVFVDQEFTWPWVWYLRDYRAVTYRSSTDGPPPDNAILLVEKAKVPSLQLDPAVYDSGQPFHLRWWFPENYRVLNRHNFQDILFDPSTWSTWRDFFVQRQSVVPVATLGSLDGVAYFPKVYTAATGGTVYEQPPEEPVAGPEGQVVIGRPGGGRGQFSGPAGLAVDGEGNVYVADSGNHRIQKFDGALNFLGAFGMVGGAEGQLNEPWGVAVDGDGNIYVADTWNHRIQKFNARFEFLKAWGGPFLDVGQREPEPLELFGPRGIALDAGGDVWVTDTGNKRVLKFDAEGDFLAQYGGAGSGPGQFEEPVGVAITPSGEILIADAWNRRIQRFSPDFQYMGEIPVESWGSQGVSDKPYLAVLSDGRILATDPANGAVLVFDSGGQQVAKWQPPVSTLEGGRPVGLAVAATGADAFVSDNGAGQVRRVPLTTLTGP